MEALELKFTCDEVLSVGKTQLSSLFFFARLLLTQVRVEVIENLLWFLKHKIDDTYMVRDQVVELSGWTLLRADLVF